MFTGLPLFLFPMAKRDDAFALFHAKHAAVTYGLFWVFFVVYFVLSFVTCGVTTLCIPILFLGYIPALHGILIVTNDQWREPFGLFGAADALFPNVRVEEKR